MPVGDILFLELNGGSAICVLKGKGTKGNGTERIPSLLTTVTKKQVYKAQSGLRSLKLLPARGWHPLYPSIPLRGHRHRPGLSNGLAQLWFPR